MRKIFITKAAVVLLVKIFFVSIFHVPTAFAESLNAPPEMSFSFHKSDMRPQFDLVQDIYASGVITKNTTEQFLRFVKENKIEAGATVIFDSPGGSLIEGMRMGNEIRRLSFSTSIGRAGPHSRGSKPLSDDEKLISSFGVNLHMPQEISGSCLSACALAYLGGIKRYSAKDSIYGVHRFKSEAELIDPVNNVQIVSGAMVDYIKKMGVDPHLFSIMTIAGPSEMLVLTNEELRSLKVVIGSGLKDTWTLKMMPEGAYLTGEHIDDRGVSKVIFMCQSSKLSSMVMFPISSNYPPERLLQEMPKAGYFVDTKIIELNSDRYTILPPKNNEMTVLWTVTPPDIAAILSAKKITGFAFYNENIPGAFVGVMMGFGDQGKDLINNFSKNCFR